VSDVPDTFSTQEQMLREIFPAGSEFTGFGPDILTFPPRSFIKEVEDEPLPPIQVALYQEDDGTVPLLEWLDELPVRIQDKCAARIKRLMDCGHELRRPEADCLRDGIYELRVRYLKVNYRLLYFFHGNLVVVLTHGLTKEREVPPREIDKALSFKKRFESAPESHMVIWEP
jgi:phage-related protein